MSIYLEALLQGKMEYGQITEELIARIEANAGDALAGIIEAIAKLENYVVALHGESEVGTIEFDGANITASQEIEGEPEISAGPGR